MDSASHDIIVDDLLRNRPKGPAGVTLTYEVSSYYCYDTYKDRKEVTCNQENYGYDEGVLFDLGFKEREQVESYISKRFFEGKSPYSLGNRKVTHTRRTNRLWDRISGAQARVAKAGGSGIYRLTIGYYSDSLLGHIHANSNEDAITMGKVFFGYVVEDASRIRAQYVNRGSVHELAQLNAEITEKLQQQVKRQEKEIASAKVSIEKWNDRIEVLNMVADQQVAVATVNELNELEESTT
jgi:hypothetical protein